MTGETECFIGIKIPRQRCFNRVALRRQQCNTLLFDNLPGNFRLDLEDVVQSAVVALGPNVGCVGRSD
jgi:hypothetical protein